MPWIRRPASHFSPAGSTSALRDVRSRGSFGFELPGRQCYALLSIEPSGESEDINDDPVVLVERLRPLSTAEMGQRPVLPERFRDSPEVIKDLEAQGVDFVAGPSDMKLEARVLASGEAVWVTYYWDEERTSPFRATAS